MKKELLSKTKKVLLEIAGEHNIVGRYKMKKDELIEAILAIWKNKSKTKLQPEKTEKKQKAKGKEEPAPKKAKAAPIKKESVVETEPEESELHQRDVFLFWKPERSPVHYQEDIPELPDLYDEIMIMAMSRDPYWLYTYWELPQSEIDNIVSSWTGSKEYLKMLRVYDVSSMLEKPDQKLDFFDMEVFSNQGNWYINTNKPGNSFFIEIGIVSKESKEFHPMARSNVTMTPYAELAPSVEEEEVWADFFSFDSSAITPDLKPKPPLKDVSVYLAELIRETLPEIRISSPSK